MSRRRFTPPLIEPYQWANFQTTDGDPTDVFVEATATSESRLRADAEGKLSSVISEELALLLVDDDGNNLGYLPGDVPVDAPQLLIDRMTLQWEADPIMALTLGQQIPPALEDPAAIASSDPTTLEKVDLPIGSAVRTTEAGLYYVHAEANLDGGETADFNVRFSFQNLPSWFFADGTGPVLAGANYNSHEHTYPFPAGATIRAFLDIKALPGEDPVHLTWFLFQMVRLRLVIGELIPGVPSSG